MFKGSLVALITPMTQNGAVDEKAYAELVDWQIKEGTQGLIPVGTTGESPTLSHDEHRRVVEICIEVAAKRVPVIAGAGSNSTEEAIALTRHAKEAGADAALVVTPYYNKPTQEGMFLHYSAIADNVDLPVIIYNIPGRSIVDMNVETMARLAKHKNIVGVKDCAPSLARPIQQRLAIGGDWCQLSGEDGTVLSYMAAGGHGCISVTANIAPRLCREMHDAWASGQIQKAIDIQDRMTPLHDALFSETSPAPVKYAASLLGKTADFCLLPLAPTSEGVKARVRAAMTAVGLLN